MMNIVIGNVARGADFFDREEILSDIWATLEADSILLAAPRRVGKTSIMHRLIDEPAPGFSVVFVDGQNCKTPEDLVLDLVVGVGELRRDPKGLIRRILGAALDLVEELELWELRVKLRQRLGGRWREDGERAVREALAGLEQGAKLLIIADELPLLLHKMVRSAGDPGKEQARDLLDWLRYIRHHPEFNTRLRMLVGGSIGMGRVASYIGASHKIADLRQIEVGPFERERAREFARHLLASRGVAPEPEVIEAIVDVVGTPLPIFIQIMASALAAEVRDRGVEPTPDVVCQCYEQRALGPEYRICFEDYYERLDRYYSPEEARAARRILRELALAREPLRKTSLLGVYQDELGPNADPSQFDLLLAWMRDDFYVEQDSQGGTVSFQNKWLRDWWRIYHATSG